MDIETRKSIALSVNETPITVCYYQEGEPVKGDVILMHTGGAGASAYMCWLLNFDALVEAGFRVTAPDAPGFGNSKAINPNAKTPNPVYFLHTFIESLEIRNPHLVGNSMGGMTISKFASDYPELVRSLTISGGEPRVETKEVSELGSLGATPRNDFVREMFSKPQLSYEDMYKATADFFYDRDHPMVDEITRCRLNTLNDRDAYEFAKENSLGQIKRRGSDGSVDYLHLLQVPTLLLHGRDEIWFYPGTHREILMDAAIKAGSVIPSCTTIILPHCAHWPQIEHSDLYNQLLIGFLNQVS